MAWISAGTKIEAAALDASGRFLSRGRVPNPGTYDAAIEAVRALIAQAEREAGAEGTIGIGSPGSISPQTGLMRNANSTFLNGRSFREDLERALGREVRMANDANCLALSEAVDGAAAGARVACRADPWDRFAAAAWSSMNKLSRVPMGSAAEWGTCPAALGGSRGISWPGVLVRSARLPRDLESRGSGLSRDHATRSGERRSTAKPLLRRRGGASHPRARPSDAYVDRLGARDRHARQHRRPRCIRARRWHAPNVNELYALLPIIVPKYTFADAWDARIVPARWGDSSGVRGAARLWASA